MDDDVRDSYDRVAGDYAEHFRDELDAKPFDRKMLDWLLEKSDAKAGGAGLVCDMGCGPGQAARYLRERGADACGVDISPAMVEHARALNPDISFEQGDMLALVDVDDNTYAGVAALYSVIHVPRSSLGRALGELRRVLRPAGVLLVAFHVGRETVRREEWWGKAVALDFNFFETEEIKQQLKSVGFVLEEVIERDPYPEVEYPSRRAYVFARKP